MPALVAAHPGAAGRRPRHVGGLEAQHAGRVGLEVAQARHGRQLVGVGHAQHRTGLLGAEGAQPDPVGEVRLQAAQATLLEPLRGQQQVQAQRAAQPADGHEEVDELRLGREHLGELVDHDEQRRQRGQVLPGGAGLLVVAHRGEVAGLAQQLLPAHHLPRQRVLHAVDEGQLLRQVRDHGRDVGHLRHPGEGRAALEVDEHQVELLGGVRQREAEHQGAQELRLARAGGADGQAVRAHALLRRLLDVEVHQCSGLAQADRHPQPVAGRPRPPGRRRVQGVHVAERQQLHEVGGPGDLARAGAGLRGGGRAPRPRAVQRGEAAGERLRGGQVALVGARAHRRLAHPQRQQRQPTGGVGRRGHLEAQPGGVLQLVPPGGQVEDRHPVQPVGRYDVVAGRQRDAVGDQQDVRGRPRSGAGRRGRGAAGRRGRRARW